MPHIDNLERGNIQWYTCPKHGKHLASVVCSHCLSQMWQDRTFAYDVLQAARSFIDDDADPWPPPGGYTLSQLKAKLNEAIRRFEA